MSPTPHAPATGVAGFVGREEPAEGTVRAGGSTLESLRKQFTKKTTSFLALAGITSPPNSEKLEARAEAVVAKARANKAARTECDFKMEQGVAMVRAVLGRNMGDDEIVEGRVKSEPPVLRLDAYDRKGFHVVSGILTRDLWKPTDLHISGLKASHGRNCDDFDYSAGEAKMPGRGNAAAIAAGLEALLEQAVLAGASSLSTLPGSDQVAALYARMGFSSKGSPRGGRTMTLDLTSKRAVKKALVVFALSRAHIKDVPKNITERIVASGGTAPMPHGEAQRPQGAQIVTS